MDINLLNDEELSLFRSLIEQTEKITLCCHRRPDGDAVGSVHGIA